MPRPCTTSRSPSPPRTREAQFDERWAFVAKKEEDRDRSDPADDLEGDCRGHVALDPEHRPVVVVAPGKRTAENVATTVDGFRRRTGGRPTSLITTDEYAPYREAMPEAYGETVTPPRTGRRGRPRKPCKVAPAGLLHATIHETRREGRVVKVEPRLVFGTEAALRAALQTSASSRAVDTSFVERRNGTDRNRDAREVRKAYSFSKSWTVHRLITYFTPYVHDFCRPVRTPADRDEAGRPRERTPAMAAGLTGHVWSIEEWLTMPAVHRS